MAIIGTMVVNIVAKTEAFTSGLNDARNAFTKFTSKFGQLQNAIGGALGIAWLKNALTTYAETGSALKDLSSATGVTVENLSFLKYAAEQTGGSIDNLRLAFKTMAKQGIDPNKFEELAAKLDGIDNPTVRAQRALKLFGKQGLTLIPMVREMKHLRAEFDHLGGPMSTQAAENADKLDDSWGRLNKALGGIRNAIASAVAPTIIWFNDLIADNSKTIKQFIKDHETMAAWLGGLGAAFLGLTPILWGFNQVMMAINTTLKVTEALAKSKVVMALIGLIAANPEFWIPALAVGGLAGYKLYREGRYQYSQMQPRPNENSGQPTGHAAEHVKEQRRTNDILSQMIRGGNNSPAGVMVAGGRG